MTNELNIDFRISGYVNQLVKNIHKEYKAKERSGIARIEKKSNYYVMTDIVFGEQTNSQANTEITEKGMDQIMDKIIKKAPHAVEEYCCWIHSHNSMPVFWSGTDNATKLSFDDGRIKKRWSVVTAYTATEILYKCALNIYRPINIEFDVDVSIEEFDSSGLLKSIIGEYEYKAYELEVELALGVYENNLSKIVPLSISESDYEFLLSYISDKSQLETIIKEYIKEDKYNQQKKLYKKFILDKNVIKNKYGIAKHFKDIVDDLKANETKNYYQRAGQNVHVGGQQHYKNKGSGAISPYYTNLLDFKEEVDCEYYNYYGRSKKNKNNNKNLYNDDLYINNKNDDFKK